MTARLVTIAILLIQAAPAVSAAFVPAGAVPRGDYDLEITVEVSHWRSMRGSFCVERVGDADPVEIRFGRDACRLASGRAPIEDSGRAGALGAGDHALVVRRRAGPGPGASYALEVDGRVVDELYVARSVDGERECGPDGMVGVRVTRLKAVRVGEAFFDDAFDRDGDAPGLGEWSPVSGAWDIVTTRDAWVAVDEGPFATSSLRVRAGGDARAVVLADPRRLARVHCAVAVRIPAGCRAGILVSAGETMRIAEIAPGARAAGSVRFALREGGGGGNDERDVLPEAPARVGHDAWTRLEVWSDWRRVRVAVGGEVVLDAEVDGASVGRVGLFASGAGDVLFDDFSVRPWCSVRGVRAWERVSQGAAASRMRFASDAWPRDGFRLEVSARPGGRLVSTPAVVSAGTLRDASAELADAVAEARVAGCRSLAIDVAGPHAILLVDGVRTGRFASRHFVASAPCVQRAFAARAEDVLIESSRREREALLFESGFPSPTIDTDNNKGKIRIVRDVFRPNSGRWYVRRSGKNDGQLLANAPKMGVLRYLRPVPGDMRVAVDLVVKRRARFERAGIIAAAGVDEAGLFTGYSLGVEMPPRDAPGAATLALRRRGRSVASSSLPAGEGTIAIALERRNDTLFCSAGGRILMAWRDPEPLRWDTAGLFVARGMAAFDRMTVEHLDGTYSDFRKVEPEWQPVSGTWKLHTGLTCIAWDHWITAFGATGAPAYLCNTSMRPRDVTVVARVSEASEGFESRTHVHHPLHDIVVAMRAREDAPRDSGYRLVLAQLPAKNAVVLYRAGVEVARAQSFRIVMGGHCNNPRMFTVVARAEGGEISCEVDGREVLTWSDPNPLPAGHVMLGAEKGRANFADVSVMVSRSADVARPARARSISGM